MESPKWDGTYLGKIDRNNILLKTSYANRNYWTIHINNMTIRCQYRQANNQFPCLFDELKILFNIGKIGTHWIYYNSKIYILLRVPIDPEGNFTYEFTIEYIYKTFGIKGFNKNLCDQIRNIYIFREIFGIISSNDSNICVRESPYSWRDHQIISTNELNIVGDLDSSILSQRVLNRWFNGDSVNNEMDIHRQLLDMINIDNYETMNAFVLKIRSHLEIIINRINRNLIWSISFFIDRMIRLIISSLNR